MNQTLQNNNEHKLKLLNQLLTEDDKCKVRLLVMDRERTTSVNCQQLCFPESNFDDFWIEVLFLIQRYDLLKLFNSCEVKVCSRLENKDNKIYFEAKCHGRVLLEIYNEIIPTMETEFDNKFEEKRSKLLSSKLNRWIESNQAGLNLADKFRLCTVDDSNLNKLSEIFSSLNWNEFVKRIDMVKSTKEAALFTSEYPMDKIPCGKCIIINIKNIDGQSPREGSEIDVDAMDVTFRNFGFNIEMHTDLEKKEIEDVLRDAARYDHSQYNALVCCIMSHGIEGAIKSKDDKLIYYENISGMFSGGKCPSLIGKPKLFFFQACQGESLQSVQAPQSANEFAFDGPSTPVFLVDKICDHVIAVATQAGCGALRFPTQGSWFIQALANAFKIHNDLYSAQLHTQTQVSSSSVTVNGSNLATQNPIWHSTLKKRVTFRRLQ
ncbi:apoptosis- cysteine peptidase [Chamberlinius hualienensis]